MKPLTKEQVYKAVLSLIDGEVEAKLSTRAGEVEPMRKAIQELSYENDKLKRDVRLLQARIVDIQHACPHPSYHQVSDVLGQGGYAECDVCGLNVTGIMDDRRRKGEYVHRSGDVKI